MTDVPHGCVEVARNGRALFAGTSEPGYAPTPYDALSLCFSPMAEDLWFHRHAAPCRLLRVLNHGNRRVGLLVAYIIKDGKLPGLATPASGSRSAGHGGAVGRGAGSRGGGRDGTNEERGGGGASGVGDPSSRGTTRVQSVHFMPPGSSSLLEAQTVPVHASEVTCMCLSYDGSLLFTAGEDGACLSAGQRTKGE